jgi:hypothetical protein
LVSDNPQKQQLAIEAILLALPEEGPKLVAVVSRSSSNKNVRQFARDSLDQRRAQLIKGVFADDKPTRISATEELAKGWRSDQDIVPALVEAATNSQDQDGVVNTLILFENIDKNLLLKHERMVRVFLDKVESNGPKTRDHVLLVRARLP